MGNFVSDFFDDLGDALDDFVEDFVEALEDTLESVAGLLGFEDETIVLAFAQAAKVNEDDWTNPLKLMAINRIRYNVEYVDQIKNLYLSGEHIRMRAYIKKIVALGWEPEFNYSSAYISTTYVKPVLDIVAGAPVKIASTRIQAAPVNVWCFAWLAENNPFGGYTYSSLDNSLTQVAPPNDKFIIDPITPFRLDPATDKYDIFAARESDGLGAEFNSWIPRPNSATGASFTVEYRLEADDPDVVPLTTWNHTTETSPPYTYPTLASIPIVLPADEYSTPLPIIPIKRRNIWMDDVDNQERTDIRAALDKFGYSLTRFTNAFKDDPNGNSTDLHSIWLKWGMNIGNATSQEEIGYIYRFFSEFALPAGISTELSNDRALVNAYWAAEDYDSSFGMTSFGQYDYGAVLSPDDNRMQELREKYLNSKWIDQTSGLVPFNPLTTYNLRDGVLNDATATPQEIEWNLIGASLWILVDAINKRPIFEEEVIGWKYGDYANTIGFATCTLETGISGSVGSVGQYVKTFSAYGSDRGTPSGPFGLADRLHIPTLTIQYQVDGSTYDELIINNIYGLSTVVDNVGDKYLAFASIADYGDEAPLVQPNSVILPLNQGYFNELGITDRKRWVWEKLLFHIYGTEKIHLEWYETPGFLSFVSGVIQIASIYSLFSGSQSTAQLLWDISKAYLGQLAVEAVLQEILLNNPEDEDLVQALSIAFGVGFALYTSDFDVGFNIDTALTSIDAVSQSVATFEDTEYEQLTDENTQTAEQIRQVNEAMASLDIANPAFLDYVKQTITISSRSPDAFYQRHLTRSLVEEALDLDKFTDVTALLSLNNVEIPVKKEV